MLKHKSLSTVCRVIVFSGLICVCCQVVMDSFPCRKRTWWLVVAGGRKGKREQADHGAATQRNWSQTPECTGRAWGLMNNLNVDDDSALAAAGNIYSRIQYSAFLFKGWSGRKRGRLMPICVVLKYINLLFFSETRAEFLLIPLSMELNCRYILLLPQISPALVSVFMSTANV